jgi:hypothetical protein
MLGKTGALKYMRILGIQVIYSSERKLANIVIKKYCKYLHEW